METALSEGAAATDVLKEDHEVIKDLLCQAADAGSDRRKKTIGDRCLREIETHVGLEEKIFYPAVRRDLGEDRLVAQALAEHAVAKSLIDELKTLPAGERYNARFRELAENLVSHIDAAETDMLPRVERSDMDIEQLGAQLLEKKRRVAASGFGGVSLRNVAVAAAGVAIVGGAAWLARRGGRRAGGKRH